MVINMNHAQQRSINIAEAGAASPGLRPLFISLELIARRP